MPTFRPTPDLVMHYESDDFTDPWRQSDTILLLHGNAESGLAWYGWVPALARHYRVVRPDMRGFGQSTPMPRDYPWTLDRLIDDFCLLLDNLRIDRFHLVGAKIGGTVAPAFAARRPPRLATADSRFRARGIARKFLPRRRHSCRRERQGDPGLHSAAR